MSRFCLLTVLNHMDRANLVQSGTPLLVKRFHATQACCTGLLAFSSLFH
jgi:hypothetical protein